MGKLTPELLREAVELIQRHGNACAASKASGIPDGTLRHRFKMAQADPAIQAAALSGGIEDVTTLSHFWKIGKDKDGNGYSLFVKNPLSNESVDIRSVINETLQEVSNDIAITMPKRFDTRAGDLLVLDPSDVHIGKLCVASETGFTYDEAIAEHRLIEGSRMLLERGMRNGITRVLFVIGNDIAHIDNPKRTTTSGTPQDTHGTIFSNYRVAQKAYVQIVKMCLDMGLHVDLVFNPSNHDFVLGYTIAQAVGLMFKEHPNVGTNDYYLSERHRKYYRFEQNLIGVTHADGAKERDLPELMLLEARAHISDTLFRYWYLHHFHHKIRNFAGIRPQKREKDHIGMTVINSGPGVVEGENTAIEYVRSPSPPDGWHDRNGYINRQAVEAFIHHPYEGQKDRLTEWF